MPPSVMAFPHWEFLPLTAYEVFPSVPLWVQFENWLLLIPRLQATKGRSGSKTSE